MSVLDDEIMEEIISEVAIKHRLLLSRDDPILITVTLSEAVQRRYLIKNTEAFQILQNNLEEMYLRQASEVKSTANKLMGAALKSGEKAITRAGEKVVSAITLEAAKVRLETDSAVQKGIDSTKFNKNLSITAALIAVGSVLISLLLS